MSFIGPVKSRTLYQGTIAVAGSFTGNKDVTLSPTVNASKCIVIGCRGNGPATTSPVSTNVAATDGSLKWDYHDIVSSSVFRFVNVTETSGVAKNIYYAFVVLEFQ